MHDVDAVIHKPGTDTIDGFVLSSAQCVITKAGDFSACAVLDLDELVAGVPDIGFEAIAGEVVDVEELRRIYAN
ncbi:hypothetical protein [Undibacterium sp. Tian12W]|uniref:hypothetical protein n=1 Tax=Undibacterium sp. Tian12W TaxID=3413054 RepID=UPI003BF45539